MVVRTVAVLGTVFITACGIAARPSATHAESGPTIIELLISQPRTDDAEYILLSGTPSASLTGLSLILVEGDVGPDTGKIDRRIDFKPFHHIGNNGYFLVGVCDGLNGVFDRSPDKAVAANFIENSSLTAALVRTDSLTGTHVNGTESVIDAIAVSYVETDTSYFNAPVIGLVADADLFIGAKRSDAGVWRAQQNLAAFAPVGGGLDGCHPLQTTISQIQGGAARSPYEGEVVVTQGVVTQYTRDGRHFWLQDGGDGNDDTSDGLFVYEGGALAQPPRVGDVIELTATVDERGSGNGLPVTRLISPVASRILPTEIALPEPVTITDLPDSEIGEAIGFWERLEGMRVRLAEGVVVGPTSRFGDFVVVAAADAHPGSGYSPESGQLLLRPLPEGGVDYNPERIMIDDDSLADPVIVSRGDRVKDVVGVVDYHHGNYRLQAGTLDVERRPLPSIPADPVSRRQGETLIGSFNLENLFDSVDDANKDDQSSTLRPEELAVKLAKLTAAVATELGYPDILVVQEVENTAVLQALADHINATGTSDYRAISVDSSDRRGIEVGLLWDARHVTLIDAYPLSGAKVDAAFGSHSASPGREPLVGIFDIGGQRVTIIGNHFKSKGGDDPLFGINQPPLRLSEVQRSAQAQAVRELVESLLNAEPQALVLVAGDFNDFSFAEPGEDASPLDIIAGDPLSDAALTNLVSRIPSAQRYTYVYEGNSQVLDHILVSAALYRRFTEIDVAHFNAAYPESLSRDATTSLRASDHDPLVARFDFATSPSPPGVDNGPGISRAATDPIFVLILAAWLTHRRLSGEG